MTDSQEPASGSAPSLQSMSNAGSTPAAPADSNDEDEHAFAYTPMGDDTDPAPAIPAWAPATPVPVLTGEVIDPPRRHGGGRPRALDQFHSEVEARPAQGDRPAVAGRRLTKRDALMDALGSGYPVSASCRYAGINEETFYSAQRSDPEFADQVARVRARTHLVALANIQRAMASDWRAADRFLQLSDPNLFGDRLNINSVQRIEIVTTLVSAVERALDSIDLDPEIRLRIAEAVGDRVAEAMGEPTEGEARATPTEETTAIVPRRLGSGDQQGNVAPR